LNQYLKKVLFQELSYVNSLNIVDTNKPKIFLALNFATSLYLIKKKISFKNLVFWKDGVMSYFWDKNNIDSNIPGRDLLKNINLNYTKINRIYFVGNINDKLSNFFNNFFLPYKKISFIKLPFLKIDDLNKTINKITIKKKSLIILNISSPKQEILAENLFLKKKNNIFCLGAAPLMLSGIEAIPPKIFTVLKLEFLWRLRKDFVYRMMRIVKSIYMQSYYFKKINSKFILKKYR
jgi:exopolysaccharide biosynthesis WecB/TagA/CpsF family protein